MKFKIIQLGFTDKMAKKIAQKIVNFHKDFFLYSNNFKSANLLLLTHLVMDKTLPLKEID